jgi:hypothetical protein
MRIFQKRSGLDEKVLQHFKIPDLNTNHGTNDPDYTAESDQIDDDFIFMFAAVY